MGYNQPIDYTTPEIVDHGDLVELTAAQVDGETTDADFPAGTPFGSILFS